MNKSNKIKWIESISIEFIYRLIEKYNKNEKGIYYFGFNKITLNIEEYSLILDNNKKPTSLELGNADGKIIFKPIKTDCIFEYHNDENLLVIKVLDDLVIYICDINYDELINFCSNNNFNNIENTKNDHIDIGTFRTAKSYKFHFTREETYAYNIHQIDKGEALKLVDELLNHKNVFIEIVNNYFCINLTNLKTNGRQYWWKRSYANSGNTFDIHENHFNINNSEHYVESVNVIVNSAKNYNTLSVEIGNLKIHLKDVALETHSRMLNYKEQRNIEEAERAEEERRYYDSLDDFERESLDNLYDK